MQIVDNRLVNVMDDNFKNPTDQCTFLRQPEVVRYPIRVFRSALLVDTITAVILSVMFS